jgi:uroporphyrinogen-III synthase
MASCPTKTTVILLKTKSTPHDGYQEYFESSENGAFEPIFVPVLQHTTRNDALEDIKNLITTGAFQRSASMGNNYGGIIFTSQRAVEGFIRVAAQMPREDLEGALDSQLPLYVVGPATARGLRTLGLACPILGESTGNGEDLALFILADFNVRWRECSPKPGLLFLVGEQRRDVIPRTLQSLSLPPEERIMVNETIVYETEEAASFAADFASVLGDKQGEKKWVVVFSPTGCKAMLSILGLLDQTTGKYNDAASTSTRIATIGPTTRDYLKHHYDFEPAVYASKPSPDGIGSVIQKFELEIRGCS